MTHPDDSPPPHTALRSTLLSFLVSEWPYLLMLALALVGVAYTSFSQAPVRTYWLALCPINGLICIGAGWREASGGERFHLVWTQILHWFAVFLTIELMLIADVARMMNADAKALSALTILALGTFTAGLHIGAWRVGFVGILLGLGVPGIAWLERSVLLILLVVVALAAVIVPLAWTIYEHKREARSEAGTGP